MKSMVCLLDSFYSMKKKELRQAGVNAKVGSQQLIGKVSFTYVSSGETASYQQTTIEQGLSHAGMH